MWKYAILLALVCGCTENLLDKETQGMDADERGKHITALWKECHAGVEAYYDVPQEDYQGRIDVLQRAYPYGRKVFQIARDKSHRANLHFAQCTALLGKEYELLAREEFKKAEKTNDAALKARAEEHRAKGKKYLREAADLLLHYETYWASLQPWEYLYDFMVFNYSNLEDYRAALLTAYKYRAKLKELAKRRPGNIVIDRKLKTYEAFIVEFKKRLSERLEEIPEDPFQEP